MPSFLPSSSTSRKILIVDDERLVRSVCDAVLKRSGFTTVLASNGLEALNLYQQWKPEIALTLSDISMPVMDGVEFVRKIFELNPTSNVILMTGFSPRETAPEDLKRLCGTVSKPFSPTQLLTAVKKCLEYQEEHHPADSRPHEVDSLREQAQPVVLA